MKPVTLDAILAISISIIEEGALSDRTKPTIKRGPDFIETKDGWLIKDTWEAKMAWAEHMLNKAIEKEGE